MIKVGDLVETQYGYRGYVREIKQLNLKDKKVIGWLNLQHIPVTVEQRQGLWATIDVIPAGACEQPVDTLKHTTNNSKEYDFDNLDFDA